MVCLAFATDPRVLVRLQNFFLPFWKVFFFFFFFFDSVVLVLRFITISDISVNSNTIRVYACVKIDWILKVN